jgi:hypothetical protein
VALTQCPDCGGKLSTDAEKCPHCGRPSRARQPATPAAKPIGCGTVAVLLVVVVVVAIMIEGRRPEAPFDRSEATIGISFEQVGFQPGMRGDLGNYFVVVDVKGVPNAQAQSDCLNIARKLCAGMTGCTVGFWTDRNKAGRSLPLTDVQAEAEIAAYTKNVNTGMDQLICHPFGTPGERCIF